MLSGQRFAAFYEQIYPQDHSDISKCQGIRRIAHVRNWMLRDGKSEKRFELSSLSLIYFYVALQMLTFS